jgi:hypothetical protein
VTVIAPGSDDALPTLSVVFRYYLHRIFPPEIVKFDGLQIVGFS